VEGALGAFVMKSVTAFVQPLQRRLPLLIAALLCTVVATFGWLVKRELSKAFEAAAQQRMSIAAQQMANMLRTSTSGLRTQAHQFAADPAVVRAVEHPDEETRLAATTIVDPPRIGPGIRPTRALWTKDCQLVLVVGTLQDSPIVRTCPTAFAAPQGSDAVAMYDGIAPLKARGDSIVIMIEAPVMRSAHDTIGFLMEMRPPAGPGAQVLGGLIGKGASIMFGNATGPEVWTDLSKRVSGPPRPIRRDVLVSYTSDAGVPQIGMATAVPTTPWMVWVQMPLGTAVAAQNQTLGRMAFIALVCVIIGVTGAWFLSNHVTRPLVELTRATKDIADGNYARRVGASRHDELGVLMSSFNSMAATVQAFNREQSALTRELEARFHEAQDLAHELEMSNQELSEAAEATRSAHREKEIAQLLLDEVLAQAPVGIAVFDDSLRFVRVNATLATMNGVAMEDHVGRRPSELTPACGSIQGETLSRVLATGETLAEQRSSGALQNGSKRDWLTNYFPVRGAQGEVTGAGVIVIDTTARNELEAQLLQSQKMDAVGRLAGGVAHDFNNLLTVISSYSQMALETLREGEPLHADMQEIRTSADRAARLTRQLLAFSRKQIMQPQVLDLNRVAMEMERMLRRLIGEDVVLALALAQDLGDVTADPGQIEQVVMNLVLNARDAMPDGGRLEISTANVTVSEGTLADASLPPGNYVTLRVRDTGTGMSEDTKTHLFEPFFTTKDTGKGTGLGLSIVYGIVKQSGGEILVHSESGRGSTFIVYLPRVTSPPLRMPRTENPTGFVAGGSETILLVEDDGALRALALRVLRDAGYVVLEAGGASEAIELGRSYAGEIHLLLTDVVMPQASGRIVGERLQAQRPNVQVLFMSGYTDDVVFKRGVQAAEANFLEKPFTPDQLTRRIRELLDAQSPTYGPTFPGDMSNRPVA
jgi:PAS domain S-box-containing protein